MGGFNIPVNIDFDIVQLPQGYTSCCLNFAFGVVCDMQDLYSQIPCQNSILFNSVHFFSFGQTHTFIWDHTPLNMEWYLFENTTLKVPSSPPYAYHR
jgi:hypothetical protein